MVEDFDISVQQGSHHATLHVTGLLDAYTGERLRSAIDEQIERGVTRVDLDASRVTFADSGGLRVLNDAKSDLEERGVEMSIIDPSATMAQILRLTDLTDRFGIEEP